MKKIIIVVLVLFVIIVGLFFLFVEKDEIKIEGVIFRADFDELNTFNQTYSRTVGDEITTIEVSLSDEELEKIYQKIINIGALNYSQEILDSCDPEMPIGITDIYYLMVRTHGAIKINEEKNIKKRPLHDIKEIDTYFVWGKYSGDCKMMKEGFESLKNVIEDIISNQEGYNTLPPKPIKE